MELTVNDISFRAKIGKNLLKKINEEFGHDKVRTDKYVQLFDETFARNIDKETVVDINKNRKFIFSNDNFQGVKFQHRSKMRKTESAAKTLINECSRIFGGGENDLFKVITRKYLEKGADFSELKKLAEKITNPKSREFFLEKVKAAERLKKENPETKFSFDEFDYIQNVIIQEEAVTPGTKLYDLIHSLDKIKFDIIV